MATIERPPKRQRGSSLIEVLVATVVLTLAFLFVSGDMIASTQAEKMAADRGITINMANYFLDFMRQDAGFWSEQSGGTWSTAPTSPSATDPCGNAWPPYSDTIATPTWHAVPVCVGSPFANVSSHGTYSYMWQAQEQTDVNAANLTVWIQAQTANGGGSEVFELNQLNRNDPVPNNSGAMRCWPTS